MKSWSASQSSGFTLIELVITIAIITSVALLSANLINQVTTSNRNANMQMQMGLLRDQFIFALQDQDIRDTASSFNSAWARTVNSPASINHATTFACLRGAGSDCTGLGRAFNPVMRDGQLFLGYQPYSNANPPVATNQGFRADGTRCTGWVAPPAAPHRDCWIRVDFRWAPVCGANCVLPEVDLTMSFQVNMPRQGAGSFNADRFSARIRRQGATTAAAINRTCPSTQVPIGYDANGAIRCDPRP